MSHECPRCGLLCHCNGDIDDCCFNRDEYVGACTHCGDDEDLEDDWGNEGDIEESEDEE
jgi:hypothetical protein